MACSSLGLVEVMATLSRKRKAAEVSETQFKQKAQEIEDDWERFVKIHVTTDTINDAKELTKRHALRGADAIHLSSAIILKKRFQDKDDRLIVVASDYELKEAAKSSGLEIIDPSEIESSSEEVN
jgi:predicted nucleic acid-binding protein